MASGAFSVLSKGKPNAQFVADIQHGKLGHIFDHMLSECRFQPSTADCAYRLTKAELENSPLPLRLRKLHRVKARAWPPGLGDEKGQLRSNDNDPEAPQPPRFQEHLLVGCFLGSWLPSAFRSTGEASI